LTSPQTYIGDNMKICISTKQQNIGTHTLISNIMNLDEVVFDCEATDIVVDNYLSQFSEKELPQLLYKILSKLRINGTITISDVDIDIVTMRYSRGDINIKDLNDLLFDGTYRKSILNLESVSEVLNNNNFKTEQSSIDSNTGLFFITVRRVAND